jgi:hypothetical protein
MGSAKEMDNRVNLQRFQQACGKIIRTLADNVRN